VPHRRGVTVTVTAGECQVITMGLQAAQKMRMRARFTAAFARRIKSRRCAIQRVGAIGRDSRRPSHFSRVHVRSVTVFYSRFSSKHRKPFFLHLSLSLSVFYAPQVAFRFTGGRKNVFSLGDSPRNYWRAR
jgi:hypothetical protein